MLFVEETTNPNAYPWVCRIPECIPVALATETTGVRSEDKISALSMKVLGGRAQGVFWTFPLTTEERERAEPFLHLPENASFEDWLAAPESVAAALEAVYGTLELPILPMCYNVDFQMKYLGKLPGMLNLFAAGMVLPLLDVVRLAWCIGQEGTPPDLPSGTPVTTLMEEVEARSWRQKGTGYKAVMPAWGVDLPDPLLPWHKPWLIEQLCIHLFGNADMSIHDCMNLPMDGDDFERICNGTNRS